MKTNASALSFFSLPIVIAILLQACQKGPDEIDISNQKPRVGSKWVYRYTTYTSMGGFIMSKDLTYRATAMETLGGEQWLKIVDSATGVTAFYLREKPDGIYQYINNNSYLMCKTPAAVNDTYTGFTATEAADYTVRSVGEVQAFGVLGNLTVNYYEGTITLPLTGTHTADKLWYNKRVWIAQRYIYTKIGVINPTYYRSATLIIQNFIY